jgi:glucose-1-phosphate thymidylyltransferase
MKAIVPVAGLGTRLRPLTYTRPKAVLKVANRPIIQFALDNLIEAGIREIALVVSDLTRSSIEQAINGVQGAAICYIDQNETLGLGHAVLTARSWVGNDDFCVYLGDNLFGGGIRPYVERFLHSEAEAVLALVEVDHPSAFGVAVLGAAGQITQLVEKPTDPPSNLAIAGIYCFRPSFFDLLTETPLSPRGEYEITGAITELIRSGHEVIGQRVQGWWKDTGRPLDLIDANRLLLETLEPSVQGEVSASRLTGRVAIDRGAVVRDSVIMGPALIGPDVSVSGCYIGPFTSIGRGSQLQNIEIEYSVIDEQVEIRDIGMRLQECLIGLRAQVLGGNRLPRAHRLTLSDASVVELA